MTLVVDSSAVVAALVDAGPVGVWAGSIMRSGPLAAPHLMPVEAANILRRAALAREISAEVASLAHDDLISMRVELFPYLPIGRRSWELRANVTAYDAWSVALAESLGADLATLDVKLSRSTGPQCGFQTPPD